jgi:hypothetical protein
MTLLFLPEKNRQKYLIIVLVAVFVVGGSVAWYGYFREGPIALFISKPSPPPQQIQINFGIFGDPAFRELGEPRLPILVPEEVGKRNPFGVPAEVVPIEE